DFEEVLIAFNIAAGNLSVGVNFPEAWESATVWDTTTSTVVGGHQIPAFSDLSVTPAGIEIDSWGEKIVLTQGGLATQASDVTIVLDPSAFGPGGTAISGFDSE